ncbi:hypothetical protein KIW84_025264 [Lathyrus oleraceus]|uniref:Uncharacterized protein n=1 Tax=Pisum sativum TaxID=3888 RepID=A0A9D4YNI8_PEA|nr:hypothetical protein KIW84_025264 [Pisum sativum]
MTINDIKYNNRKISIIISINMINTHVKILGDNTIKNSFILVEDVTIIKAFGVTICPPRAPNIKEVIWSPPKPGWIKCNCDEAFNASFNIVGAGGIFRNHLGDFVFGFAEKIESNPLFLAGVSIVIKCMDYAI